MKFKTAITELRDGEEFIRGEALKDLMVGGSFVSALFFILTGKKPAQNEERVLNAILTSVIDHGPAVASALNARISASSKNPVHASLAAGLLGLGERHGVALSGAMEFFYSHKDAEDLDALVANLKKEKVRIPGYGHKFFTDFDPRSRTLFQIATDAGVYGEYCVFSLGVHAALNKVSSKTLPLNVDGAIAAILCDMGVDADLGNAFFMIARVPGLLAHIAEERVSGEGIRRLKNEDVEFVG